MIATRLVFFGLAIVFAGNVHAANTQQNKMTACNKEASARTLKGDERKQFMSECLKASAPQAVPTQQQKMTICNKEASAKSLKGDERKQFMSECLKK